jgi:glycosyltransferase involved in cell wall biosynthesis
MITAIFSTLDDEVGLALALAALVPAATEGVVRDVIVIDDGSRDGTLKVADTAGCTIVREPGEAGRREALQSARGDWLLFFSPQAMLPPDWQDEVLAFTDRAIMAGKGREWAAVFRLRHTAAGFATRFADRLAVLRTRLVGKPLPEQGLLISKSLYRAAGGPRLTYGEVARHVGRRNLTLLATVAMVRDSRTPRDPFSLPLTSSQGAVSSVSNARPGAA